MVVGGLFNAFAFAGAGFLFSKLNHSGYKEEATRHNLALEQLSKAKEKWYEKEVARKNDIEAKRHQLADANADINVTNKALSSLSKALEYQITKLELESKPKPTLNDYYKPSKEMEEYQMITIAVVGVGSGFVGHEIFKRLKRR